MTNPFNAQIQRLIATNDGPLLFINAHILTGDSLIGNFEQADLLLGGERIVAIGPGLVNAAEDDQAAVIDCQGRTILPASLESFKLYVADETREHNPHTLSPGNLASFIILPSQNADALFYNGGDPVGYNASECTVIIRGKLSSSSAPTNTRDGNPASEDQAEEIPAKYLGTWIDENDFVHQTLTADGRYDETRGGRAHAFQGSFWITGERIDYRDDLGFWAFGEFKDDVLYHAGYTFHRA